MKKTYIIASIGVLSALSIVLVLLIHFPIFPAVAFLEYDPADVPIILSTALFGPVWGLLMTAVVAVVQGLTVSAGSGLYGILMHITATGAFVLAYWLALAIIRRIRGEKEREHPYVSSIIASAAGVIAQTAIMIPANLVITPIFMGVDVSVVINLLTFIILFNLIKASANAFVAALLYAASGRIFNIRNTRKG